MIGNIFAGTTVDATVTFIIPTQLPSSTALTITYKLMDSNGNTYLTGLGNSATLTSAGSQSLINGSAIIGFPTSLPPSVDNELQYILLWSLTYGTQTQSQSEVVVVESQINLDLGAQDLVVLTGTNPTVNLVLPNVADANSVTVTVYCRNQTVLGPLVAVNAPVTLSTGYLYQVALNIAGNYQFPASLEPYLVSWNYTVNYMPYSELSQLYVITPSMAGGLNDINLIINKARVNIGEPAQVYNPYQLMTYARQGSDQFNGFGQPTNFTMTNAIGPVRFYWLSFAEIWALRAQYLFEGVRAFEFGSKALDLNVDRTSYYQSLADTIQQTISNECSEFKTILNKRGLNYGDGNINPVGLAFGSIGSLGVALSPVTNLNWGMNWWIGRLFL